MSTPPFQQKITEESLADLKIGRRQLITEWQDSLKEKDGENWSIVLPFVGTFENSFKASCDCNAYHHHGSGGRLIIFLNDTAGDSTAPQDSLDWLEAVENYVAIQDLLALSFALDYSNQAGNPNEPRSDVALLRARAKAYEGQAVTKDTKLAATELAELCSNFIESMICYQDADCIVAIPPSDPTKAYNLPRFMAKLIAKAGGIEDLSEHVETFGKRLSIKNAPVNDKLKTLKGSIVVADDVFEGRVVILLDDLYQSGTSMNYCAHLLLEQGADRVYGLACEKTCRNDDNVR